MRRGRARLTMLSRFDALLLVSLAWFLGKFVRYVFPPLFDTFRVAYAVTPATLGLLYSALLFAYAAMQFPAGVVADAYGPTRIMAGGALVVAVASFILYSVQALPVLVLAMVLIGLGTGVHKTVAIDLLGAVYPERTGRALGAMDAIGGMAGVVAPAAVVALLSIGIEWSVAFLVAGLVGVGLAITILARIPRRVADAVDATGDGVGGADDAVDRLAAYLAALSSPRFVLFIVVVVVFAFAWNGVLAFLPLYLTTAKALTTGQAGLLYGALFLVGLVQPLTGALSDRVGRYPVLVATMVLAGGGIALLVASDGFLAIALLVGAIGLGGHGFRPPRDAHLVAVIPQPVSAGTIGIVRTGMLTGGAMAPAVVGFVSEAAGFDLAVSLLAAAIVVGVGFVAVSGLAPGPG